MEFEIFFRNTKVIIDELNYGMTGYLGLLSPSEKQQFRLQWGMLQEQSGQLYPVDLLLKINEIISAYPLLSAQFLGGMATSEVRALRFNPDEFAELPYQVQPTPESIVEIANQVKDILVEIDIAFGQQNNNQR